MDEAIYALLTSKTSITALVDDRIFPVIRDQDAGIPAITYRIVSTNRGYNSSGKGIVRTYLDLFFYAASYTNLIELMEMTETSIDEAEGVYGSKDVRYTEITDSEAQDYIEKSGIYTGRIELLVFSD